MKPTVENTHKAFLACMESVDILAGLKAEDRVQEEYLERAREALLQGAQVILNIQNEL